MSKNEMISEGLPLFVNHKEDIKPFKGIPSDSWYVNFAFEAEGKPIGVMWHHQHLKMGPVRICFAELLLLDGANHSTMKETAKVSRPDTSAKSDGRIHIHSSIGALTGDHRELRLKLDIAEGAVDVVLKPDAVLYNGTSGLLPLVGADSHEFAYPNMSCTGTVTLKEKTYLVDNVNAWFDKQWVTHMPDRKIMSRISWLWFGLTLNDAGTESISVWDYYQPGKRNAFATIRRADGVQLSVNCDIAYDEIWTSQQTGHKLPKKVTVKIPEEEFNLTIVGLIDDAEFVQKEAGIAGCQNLCHVTGEYHGNAVNTYMVLEMINDICGD